MTRRWLPSAAEERWLTVAAQLRDAVPPGTLEQETGGWRGTGPLARIALFVLGVVAAALVLGLVGIGDESGALIAGLIALGAAEWLKVSKRLHASGIEEGLCVAGSLMLGVWIVTLQPDPALAAGSGSTLVLIAAVALAGLRLLNPLVTTAAVIALVDWVASSIPMGLAPGGYARAGAVSFLLSLAVALVALALGARVYRRPAHDRMLDWLVATLPAAACVKLVSWGYLGTAAGVSLVEIGWPLRVVVLLVVGTVLLVAGIRRRRHAPLLGCLACLAGLAVELRFAAQLSNEAWLITCGVATLLAGAVLDRLLRTPRHGVTSVPPARGSDLLDPLQAAGAAVLSQQSAPGPAPAESAMSGEGGRFGGGGASGSY